MASSLSPLVPGATRPTLLAVDAQPDLLDRINGGSPACLRTCLSAGQAGFPSPRAASPAQGVVRRRKAARPAEKGGAGGARAGPASSPRGGATSSLRLIGEDDGLQPVWHPELHQDGATCVFAVPSPITRSSAISALERADRHERQHLPLARRQVGSRSMPAGACRGSSSTTRWVTDGASTRGLEQEPAGSGPFDGAFRLFLMGFVAVSVGGLTWGLVLRRLPHLRLAGYGLLAVAVLGFLAITVGDNIVHDVTLLSSYAAWVLVGLGADRGLGQAGARAGAPASSHNAAHGRRAADAR